LKDEPEALMRAASKAQKAVDFIVDPYVEHSRIRAPDEDPCKCKQCEQYAEWWSEDGWIIPKEVFFENFHAPIIEEEEE
jgi:hypothetical protein